MVLHLYHVGVGAPSRDAPLVQLARAAVLLLIVTPLALHTVRVLTGLALETRHRLRHELLDEWSISSVGTLLHLQLPLERFRLCWGLVDPGAPHNLPIVAQPLLSVVQPVSSLPVQAEVVGVATVFLAHLADVSTPDLP